MQNLMQKPVQKNGSDVVHQANSNAKFCANTVDGAAVMQKMSPMQKMLRFILWLKKLRQCR